MRIIAFDVHRVFAEAVALENGGCRQLGRIGMTRDHLVAFATMLQSTGLESIRQIKQFKSNYAKALTGVLQTAGFTAAM